MEKYVVIVTELLLYYSLVLLAGGLLFRLLPAGRWPEMDIPEDLYKNCSWGIAIGSFGPLFPLIVGYADDIGFWNSIIKVLFTISIGQYWILTCLLCIILYLLFRSQKADSGKSGIWITAFSILILLIVLMAKSGHAASLAPVNGFLAHLFHILAVFFWVGPLIVAGWFSKPIPDQDWSVFTKWFTPLATGCVAVILISGFFTMQVDIKTYTPDEPGVLSQYQDSWMVNYGQALLIKHILIIPLLVYALVNRIYAGIQLKRKRPFHLRGSVRAEGVIALIVFTVTAFMGQQFPPHRIPSLLKVTGPSPLFDVLYPGEVNPEMHIEWQLEWVSVIFFIFSVFTLVQTARSIWHRNWGLASIFTALAVIGCYAGVMFGIQ